MKKLRRIMCLILSMVMVLSSANIITIYADNEHDKTDPGNNGEFVTSNDGDLKTTGYKVELLFLDLDEDIYKMKPSDEKNQKITTAWNNADISEIQHIGEPLYFTSTGVVNSLPSYHKFHLTANAFRYGDSDYGLGDKAGKTGISRGNGKPISVTLQTFDSIKNTAGNISFAESNLGNIIKNYSTYDLPVFVGNASITSSGDYHNYFRDYFMALRPEETKTEYTGKFVARPTLPALVNYISTEGGVTDNFIYFNEVYVNDTEKVVKPGMPESNSSYMPNCYDEGIYKGQTGVYKIIFSTTYRVNASGFGAMHLTARDLIYVSQQQRPGDPGAGSTAIGVQCEIFQKMLENFELAYDDIWGLKGVSTTKDQWGNLRAHITHVLDDKWGGGLAIFTSTETEGPIVTGTSNYIGSITNVFLPGALEDDNQNISVASLEYIGNKNAESSDGKSGVFDDMNNASIQISKAIAGETIPANENMLSYPPITRDAILNGTIKLPGINVDDVDTDKNKDEQKELIEQLELLIDDYGEGVRTGIKDALKEELGIDIDHPESSPVSMQDFNLAVYVIAKYNMDGVEATDNYRFAPENSAANRWKQVLTYQAMMNGEKSKQLIETDADKKWNGPLSITADDIRGGLNTANHFSTYAIKDDTNAHLQAYPNTEDGANKAIEDKYLDDPEKGGQITIETNQYSPAMSSNVTTWQTMLKQPKLQDGLMRIPIAVGNTQLYFGAGENADEPVDVPKGLIPKLTGVALQSALGTYVDSLKENGGKDSSHPYTGVTLANSVQNLWGNTVTVQKIGSNQGGIGDISSFQSQETRTLASDENAKLYKPISLGPSFNTSYKINIGTKDDETLVYNTFGLNQMLALTVAGVYNGFIPAEEKFDSNGDYSWAKVVNALHSANDRMLNNRSEENAKGAVVVPSYVVMDERNNNTSADGKMDVKKLAEIYKDDLTKMDTSASVINDSLFANTSSDDPNFLLAASNYFLNRGLASDMTKIRTRKAGNYDSTQLTGNYGISYIVYDAGIPVDIQFAAEVNGQIMPLELASDEYDDTLISNVWYAAPNVDKTVQLQKYYTVKDKDGKAHTLEVEEAVVKSAAISTEEELNAFYSDYTKAYNNNSKAMFITATHAKTEDNTAISPMTKRTIFDRMSPDQKNTDCYVRTHQLGNLSPSLRYINSSGNNLGIPTSSNNLTSQVYNAITITPSIYDKEAYLADPTANRLQVIIKVRKRSEITQYNMIQGLRGDYVEEVTPQFDDDGKVIIEPNLPTNTGYAARTPVDPDDPEDNPFTGNHSSVFMLEQDINPNDERDDWTWEGFKNSKEDDKYRFLDDTNRPDPGTQEDKWMENPILDVWR